jgi:hypothetical protein
MSVEQLNQIFAFGTSLKLGQDSAFGVGSKLCAA